MQLGMKWGRHLNVFPVNNQQHFLDEDCWCKPVVVTQGAQPIILHRPKVDTPAVGERIVVQNLNPETIH